MALYCNSLRKRFAGLCRITSNIDAQGTPKNAMQCTVRRHAIQCMQVCKLSVCKPMFLRLSSGGLSFIRHVCAVRELADNKILVCQLDSRQALLQTMPQWTTGHCNNGHEICFHHGRKAENTSNTHEIKQQRLRKTPIYRVDHKNSADSIR